MSATIVPTTGSPSAADQGAGPGFLERTREELRNALEAKRTRILREIGAHPRPIHGCDVYFNELLADRARLTQELTRLDELDSAALIETFIADSPDIDEEVRSKLRSSLPRALARV